MNMNNLNTGPMAFSSPGPNGIKNFNPGIFRDGILPNPGIPGFFGTGFSNIFDPGILGKTFGIFWDFHFYFICLSNWIIFINLYHHHCRHHLHCTSATVITGQFGVLILASLIFIDSLFKKSNMTTAGLKI